MFEELRRVLAHEAGLPMEQEELLDALWLATRVPSGRAAPLAAHAPPSLDPRTTDAEPPRADPDPDPDASALPGSVARTGHSERRGEATRPAPHLAVASGPLAAEPPTGALWTPGARALGPTLALGRALRPLKRRVPSRRRSELDEAATADLQADTRIPQLVLRAEPERWLRLALIIDGGVSMPLWQGQCAELRGLLERSGAFRQVETHQLRYDVEGAGVRLGRPWTTAPPTRPADTVSDTSGRTMVLVVTDGAAPAWRDGRLRPVLEGWARCGPTAVIHTLPRRLWKGSGVRADTWQVTSPRPGAANAAWTVADRVLPPSVAPPPPVPVPVLEPTAAGFAVWAAVNTLVGRPVPVPVWAPNPSRPPVGEPVPVSVRDFARAASPEALRLAGHLAAMAPVTVPVMQLVHSCLDQGQGTAPLAEVFLGGLVQPLPQSGDTLLAGRHRLFDFTAEAKDLLLDAVPTAELLDCSRRVGERIESLIGRSTDFPAWPLDGDGTGATMPFAHLGPAMRVRLGVRDPSLDGAELAPPAQETAFAWVSREGLEASVRLLCQELGVPEPDATPPRWDFVMSLVDSVAESRGEPPADIRPRLREQYLDAMLPLCAREVSDTFSRMRDVPHDTDVLLLHLLEYVHDRPAAVPLSEAEIVEDLTRYLGERGLHLHRESHRGPRPARRSDLVCRVEDRYCPVEVRRTGSPFGWPDPAQVAQYMALPADPAGFLLMVDDEEKPGGAVPLDECVAAWPDLTVTGLRFQNRAPAGLPFVPGNHRICIAVDIVGYGRMGVNTQARMRAALGYVLEHAARMTGVRRRAWVRQDRGGGSLVLLPHGMDEARVVRGFIDGLTQGMQQAYEEGKRLRVRAAMDLGAAAMGEHGAVGEAVLRATRMADSAVLRRSGTDAALVVSEPLYAQVPELHGRLRRVRIEDEGLRTWAWLWPDLLDRLELPDRGRSNAVLIGAGAYEDLPDLPQVLRGLVDLSDLLSDPADGAFAPERTMVLANPESRDQILEAVGRAAAAAEDMLLVYFAGHSMFDSVNGDLSLAVRDTRPYSPVMAVSTDEIRELVIRSPARHKVVVLDCYYGGAARTGSLPGVLNIPYPGNVLVMAASAQDTPSPSDGRYTAFTGELIDILRNGLDNGPEIISVDLLCEEAQHRLSARNLRQPVLGGDNAGGVGLARNRVR
ncbi:SAV_2336 N-terminal domain-related protein [Streptomyces sp. NPDC006458]|uniref:caspase, EACC1-associated type n=1 Tax=Streptomyces sp. NPDC006458 TaxID=3154302 RepID=UPI0033AECC27